MIIKLIEISKLTYTFHICEYNIVLRIMRKLEDELDQEQESFSSPIQGIELSTKKACNGSPSEMTFEFYQSGSFKKIIEK